MVLSLDFNFCLKTSTLVWKEGVGMELIFSVTVSSLSKVPQLTAVLHVAVLYTSCQHLVGLSPAL